MTPEVINHKSRIDATYHIIQRIGTKVYWGERKESWKKNMRKLLLSDFGRRKVAKIAAGHLNIEFETSNDELSFGPPSSSRCEKISSYTPKYAKEWRNFKNCIQGV